MGKSVKIEIMDTTLRDGEQTSGVSFVPHEKLMIARLLLEDLKVDRVEVASARVSDGDNAPHSQYLQYVLQVFSSTAVYNVSTNLYTIS